MTENSLAIFTICSNNYTAMAAVLIATAKKHHPDAAVYLCLADKLLPDPSFYPKDCAVVVAEDLAIPDFSLFAFRYDVLEFNTALKPFMLLHLLDLGHRAVLYFDPDIEILAPVDEAVAALDDGTSFVLTPHLLLPAEGDSEPDDVDIMLAGVYNLGFIGVGATPEAREIVHWWARRLRFQCISDQSRGLFVDQRFIDLVPGFADRVRILRSPRYNVAYWNLAQRGLTQQGSGWEVDGAPLSFFHFSGFDPTDLSCLSRYTSAFRNGAVSPPLDTLMRHYSDQVMANGYKTSRAIRYAYGYFASGNPITVPSRRLFRNNYADFVGDPFATFEVVAPPSDRRLMSHLSSEELSIQLEAVYASASWRITEPVRALKRLAQKVRGRFTPVSDDSINRNPV